MEWRPEFITPLLAALAAGSLIGYEREFRARAAKIVARPVSRTAAAVIVAAWLALAGVAAWVLWSRLT